MLFRYFLLIFLPFSFGLRDIAVMFSYDYFKHRDVKIICLFSCDPAWSLHFVKAATKQSIAITNVRLLESKLDIKKVNNCLQQSLHAIGALIDMNCPKLKELLYYASCNRLFDSKHKWLLIHDDIQRAIWDVNENANETIQNFDEKDKTNYLNNISSILDQFDISVDTDITLSIQQGPTKYELHEAYNFGKVQGGNIVINKVGSWNNDTGLDANFNIYKYYRRWNFQQWTMRQIAVISTQPKVFAPEMITGRRRFPGVTEVTRRAAMALAVVAEIHNFRYKYTITDRWISDFNENGSTAVATSLYRREQDISPIIRYMKSIQDKIDIVHPTLTSIETRYFYRIPTYGAGKLENQFLRPLTTGAWYCVTAVIVLCASALLLSAKLEARPSPLQYAAFSVVALFCQQFFEDSGERETSRVSIARKLTVLVTGLSFVLIYNYYTSSVVSWLLNGPPPSINSLEELLESPLELIYEDIGYTRSWLQTPSYYYNKRNAKVEDEMRQKKVFNKKTNVPLLVPLDKGIEMVKAGGYAYHTEVDTANLLISQKFAQSELCELGSLQSMEKTLLYIAVQKNSPYKEFFVWNLARLLERGIISCIQHRTSSPPVECEGSSPRALALGGAAPAFLLLAAGYFLATVVIVLERFHVGTKK